MEVNSFDLIGFDLFGVDLNSIDINTDNSVSVKDDYIPLVQNPYINGHITTSDNTFTFSINNTDVTVNVDSNGNFKYKPTSTITSLSFVGVPQLESLELFKINSVTSFDVDYPTEVTFKKCDTTTQNAKVDVYHIRGTATSDFTFTLKYIDDNNNVTEVTESAVIDENGKWDVNYSGKKIYSLEDTYRQNNKLLTIDFFGSNLDGLTSLYRTFNLANKVIEVSFKGQKLNSVTTLQRAFRYNNVLSRINLQDAELSNVTTIDDFICDNPAIETLAMPNLNFQNVQIFSGAFSNLAALETIIVPQNSTFSKKNSNGNNINFSSSENLDYENMLRIANWLSDHTDGSSTTVTFCKATYDALTVDQQATLQGIIVTQKHWTLATA